MLRSAGPPEYRKALVAAGAAVGVGLIAYRLWSRRRPASRPDGDRMRTRVEIPPVQKPTANDTIANVKPKTAEVQKPIANVTDVVVSTTAKEDFSVNPEVTSADVLSVSGTFVKISPSASPVSFEEIGTAYVEPMSLPSTPPLIVEPTSFKSSDPSLSAYDQLSSSSMSFVTIPSESSAALLPQGSGDASDLPLDLDTTLSEGDVSITEKNDIVVIGSSSEQSSQNSSQKGDEDAEVVSAPIREEPAQSRDDAPEVESTSLEVVEHGADSATLDQSSE